MSFKSFFVQMVWTFFLSIQCSTISFACAWPSYTMKLLESESSPIGFKLNKYQSNLVGSIPMAGSVIATLAAGSICQVIGRKKTSILTNLVLGVAWSLILTARSFTQITIGRLLLGMSSGLAIVVIFVYVGEITQMKNRGVCIPLVGLMYNAGTLVSYLLGWFCSYEAVCYISVTAAVVHTLVTVIFLRDPPGYLLSIGQDKAALASLKFYRGEYTSETSEAVLDELSYFNEQRCQGKKITDTEKSTEEEKQALDILNKSDTKNPWKLIVTVDYNRRALTISVATMALSVCMGMIAIQTYAGKFFTMAAPSMSPDLCSVIMAIEFVICSIIMTVITDMIPRRLLMISSSVVATVCLAVLGSLLRWSWGPVWVAPLVIAIYVFFLLMGPINMAFLQMSECFGPEVNSIGTAFVLCTMFGSNFIVLSIYVPAVDFLGIDGTFFVFTACGVMTTMYSILFMKETRNETIENIQNMFARGFLYKKSELL